MKSLFTTFLPVLFLCLLPCSNYAAIQGIPGHCQPHAVCADAGVAKKTGKNQLLRHSRFFNLRHAWLDVKAKIKRKTLEEKEKASFTAKMALYLFIGALVLQLILRAASTVTPVISTIIGLAYLASIVLSLIVVFSEDNRKSKAIAKALLIVYAISILITLVLFIFLIAFLSGL